MTDPTSIEREHLHQEIGRAQDALDSLWKMWTLHKADYIKATIENQVRVRDCLVARLQSLMEVP